MFENLSSREKKLLMGVGTLVPISLLFLLVFWWIGAIDENNRALMALDQQIAEQKDLEIEGKLANRRKNYYRYISLPKSINDASNTYQRWLKSTIAETGLKLDSITPRDGSSIRSGNQQIGTGKLFQVRAIGRLEHFNDFLTAFYSVNLMHRIQALKLIPITEKSNNKNVRNGLITIIMAVEIMSLKEGQDREQFQDLLHPLPRPKEQYAAILQRNIFGPANNQPVLDGPLKKSLTTGRDVSFSINGKDADSQDLLEFKLIESSVKEAKLEQRRPQDRRARFTMPDQKPGNYEFKIQVVDNGYPSKSTTETLTVTIKEKRPAPTRTVRKKPQPKLVDDSKLVRLQGISTDNDGVARAWIYNGKTGERFRLPVGESFQLGEHQYSIIAIKDNQVKMSGNERTFVAQLDFQSKGQLVEISDTQN